MTNNYFQSSIRGVFFHICHQKLNPQKTINTTKVHQLMSADDQQAHACKLKLFAILLIVLSPLYAHLLIYSHILTVTTSTITLTHIIHSDYSKQPNLLSRSLSEIIPTLLYIHMQYIQRKEVTKHEKETIQSGAEEILLIKVPELCLCLALWQRDIVLHHQWFRSRCCGDICPRAWRHPGT